MEHMSKNNLLSSQQYGFVTGRSTVLQLIEVIDRLTEILDKGGCIDVIYRPAILRRLIKYPIKG